MAYTQDDLDRLEAAMAKGARRVRQGSEEVEFRTLEEMERQRRRMRRALGLEGGTTGGRVITVETSRGWR